MISLESTINALLAPGKGILAADESFPTIGKRFNALDIPSTEDNRRDYRETLFTTPGLGQFISGAILFDETIRQRTKEGVPFAEFLSNQGIVPGIKVDLGTVSLANFPAEKITQGLDGLRERLVEYRSLGARFTKWRAVIAIGDGTPSRACVEANAMALALFAALSQEAGLAPIVEPEVLMNGDHTIARAEEIIDFMLNSVFAALFNHRVVLEQMLLKSAMALPGENCPAQSDVHGVAEATRRCLRRAVPAAVPGIVFLSGGQSAALATRRLNAICQGDDSPWKMSFSFGRALQDLALATWKGSSANVGAAQDSLCHRARCNSFAIQGDYSAAIENGGPAKTARARQPA
jgi:fructose-bisphosphate aldolase class I